jgi:carbamoyl-phosphate synthase small subunit
MTKAAHATRATLQLADGQSFEGNSFGRHARAVAGEVVFNTGMIGYPEALTDPSYNGQILVLTYPLIGNYGVPQPDFRNGVDAAFESNRIQVSGLIVSETSFQHDHWNGGSSFAEWLDREGVPGLSGVDTRQLTKHLRSAGSMPGRITVEGQEVSFCDPDATDLVAAVTTKDVITYAGKGPRVILVDCGCKNGIIRNLVSRDVTVIRVPYDYDFFRENFDAVLVSNGPGDPKRCTTTISNVRKAIELSVPIFGICLGSQILALAAGADTYKLKYGHRSQNQPCVEVGTKRCFITSQNHGYAVDPESLPAEWLPWFVNANDGTNEGIRHSTKPFRAVQFHPEGCPGPVDTVFLFDEFLALIR